MNKGDIVLLFYDGAPWVGVISRIVRRGATPIGGGPYSVTSVQTTYGVDWIHGVASEFWFLNWEAEKLQLYDMKRNYEIQAR